jgi:translation initiation factor 1
MTPDDEKPFHNPFGALKDKLGDLPRGPERAAAAASKGPARAVVRLERKGRGGKEVTAVEQLGLGARELEQWVSALKTALGCGGAVEDGAIVLQGDQRKRLPKLLEARGVRKVTIG